ncbi:deoxyribose-phosphate aldolase [Hathewaya proteolytica DSM 3090]|uniref:Deoxyribose-phosphate aldolase n=1 Tax=Hathewaya proteolytica DSM 3090 TaxID=1121331 RepID=A0A1M6JPL9_9CLOT|nr:deoxyribose-phosphate aldolase [Hathewaya proteolytica]SHJ48687.1 deoxyribose-phosphate aldolase [Hathewaya proteolytica DSM 3090]
MDINNILTKVDHTMLNPTCTEQDILKLCREALEYKTASVCVPPCYVKTCHDYLKGKIPVCTVVGFPNGYCTSKIKLAETTDAIENGADEIDMVINIGMLKDKKYEKIKKEIKDIKSACGDKILKVIVETCLLSDDEITMMCHIVAHAGADFIKTSTGFSTGGATFHHVKLMNETLKGIIKIKAAGGISSLEDAEKFISLGADRLGTSKIIKLINKGEK